MTPFITIFGPPIEVATLWIWLPAPIALSIPSNCSRAIPGPQITKGIWSGKTIFVSRATLSKKPRRTPVESSARFPPPLIENEERSLIPWPETSKINTSSFSTTTRPAFGWVPAAKADLTNSRSTSGSPPSNDISTSSPGAMICVWWDPISIFASEITPWTLRLSVNAWKEHSETSISIHIGFLSADLARPPSWVPVVESRRWDNIPRLEPTRQIWARVQRSSAWSIRSLTPSSEAFSCRKSSLPSAEYARQPSILIHIHVHGGWTNGESGHRHHRATDGNDESCTWIKSQFTDW